MASPKFTKFTQDYWEGNTKDKRDVFKYVTNFNTYLFSSGRPAFPLNSSLTAIPIFSDKYGFFT